MAISFFLLCPEDIDGAPEHAPRGGGHVDVGFVRALCLAHVLISTNGLTLGYLTLPFWSAFHFALRMSAFRSKADIEMKAVYFCF
jgi:hypothetical protein